MSANEIRNIALTLFARDGYQGVSLREIAEEVGIKKPSIYAHFNGKEELFLEVVKYSIRTITRRIFGYFQDNSSETLETKLKGFFDWIEEEFKQNDMFTLWLRSTYFPPSELENQIKNIVNPFYDTMERLFIRLIRNNIADEQQFITDAEQIALAYLTIFDGAVLELLYTGPERYRKRVKVTWPIYWRGIKVR